MTDTDVVLVEGVRTPHGELLGSLADASAVELGRTVVDGLLERVDLEGEYVDWVSLGNAIQAGTGQVPARQVVVESGLPNETPVTTINEASGSGVRAITLAADRIAAGRADVAVAGGFESMTNAPWILPEYRKGRRHGDVTLKDSMIFDSLWDVNLDIHMGEITERLIDRYGEGRANSSDDGGEADGGDTDSGDADGDDARERYDLSREAQDAYALESHQWAHEAIEAGEYDDEIVPVATGSETVDRDEGPRPESTIEDLAALSPAFRRDGAITPANASKLADGAGAVLLADRTAAEEAGLDPVMRLVDYALVYREPDEFNEAVGDVVEQLLETTGLESDDLDACWINEAFAAQSVYVMQRLGIPRERMNPLGGAVAYGHPIGASGGMLTASLAHQVRRDDDVDRGLVGMSQGGGGAIMSLWERV